MKEMKKEEEEEEEEEEEDMLDLHVPLDVSPSVQTIYREG